MQALVRLSHNDGYIALPHSGIIGEKCFSQNTMMHLFSSGAEQTVDNHAVSNLKSYPLSCTANTGWYLLVKRKKLPLQRFIIQV